MYYNAPELNTKMERLQTVFKAQGERRDFWNCMFRRTPCMIILLINCLFFLVLLSCDSVVYFMYAANYKNEVNFMKEDSIIDGLNENLALFHKCQYNFAQSGEKIDQLSCSLLRRPFSHIGQTYLPADVQHWKSSNLKKPEYCPEITNNYNCHESLGNQEIEFRTEITECSGLGKLFKSTADWRILRRTLQPRITAPAITKKTVSKLDGKILLANELIVRCPICVQASKAFTFDKKTYYVKLDTLTPGWPLDFEFCKSLIEFEPTHREKHEAEKHMQFKKIDQEFYDNSVSEINKYT